MDEIKKCNFCGKEFSETKKPFIPVNSESAFHWKCYIKKVKQDNDPDYQYEEVREVVRNVAN